MSICPQQHGKSYKYVVVSWPANRKVGTSSKCIVVSILAESTITGLRLTCHYVLDSHPRIVWDIRGHVCLDEKTEQITSLNVFLLNTAFTTDLTSSKYFSFLSRYHVFTNRTNTLVHACNCTGAISRLMIYVKHNLVSSQ